MSNLMAFLIYLLEVIFLLWVIFLGGADRLENTILGYLEFGRASENASVIRAVAWVSLIGAPIFYIYKL